MPASQCSASLISASSKPAAESFFATRSRSQASSACWQFSNRNTRMSYIGSLLITRGWKLRLPALPLLESLVKAAGQRGHAAVELQAQQLRGHLLGRQAGARAKRIYIHRVVAHVREQAAGRDF